MDDFLQERIADPTALPKRIDVLDALPLTPIGKIFKPDLRAIAIRWAIELAAEKLGIRTELSINERLSVLVRTDEQDTARLKDALSGMPIDIRVESF